jgi:hypothetical protein
MPYAVRPFVHRTGFGVPVVEVAGQGHVPGCRGLKGELSHGFNLREVFIFE